MNQEQLNLAMSLESVSEVLNEEDERFISNILFQDRVLDKEEEKRLIKLYDDYFGFGIEK